MDIFADNNSEPKPPVLASDWGDDDPQYVDSLVGYDASPPTPDELPTGEATLPDAIIPKNSRMIGSTFLITPPMTAPIMAFPADPKRKRLYLHAPNSPGLYISDNRALLQPPTQTGNLWEPSYGLAYQVTYPQHYHFVDLTSAIWFIAAPSAATTTYTVSWLSVTE